jgi:hypothetical protein
MYKLFKSVKFFFINISNLLNICLLKTKPENIVYSKFLLTTLLAINAFIHYQGNIIGVKFLNKINYTFLNIYPANLSQTLSIIFVILFGSGLFIYFCLFIIKKQNRFVQIFSSMMIIDLVFRLGLILVMFIHSYYVSLSLIIMILLMYWQLIVLSFVFANGFDIGYLKSIILVFMYMFFKYNLNMGFIKYFLL